MRPGSINTTVTPSYPCLAVNNVTATRDAATRFLFEGNSDSLSENSFDPAGLAYLVSRLSRYDVYSTPVKMS
jgi:hypothetical protein